MNLTVDSEVPGVEDEGGECDFLSCSEVPGTMPDRCSGIKMQSRFVAHAGLSLVNASMSVDIVVKKADEFNLSFVKR